MSPTFLTVQHNSIHGNLVDFLMARLTDELVTHVHVHHACKYASESHNE